jgi:RNA polymerase sigma-70 factor (ECF subfamily)
MIQAVDKLPEAQKEVVYLVYVQGLSYEEAAATLEIPAGTLTSRLVRGRTKIAAMISDPSAQKRSSE